MILMKSALSSILVLLGACDRAVPTSNATAPAPAAETVTATEAGGAGEAQPETPTAAPAASASAVPRRHAAKTVYVCPMHPEVTSDQPGLCPKCNMKLDPKPQVVEVRPAATSGTASSP